MRLYRILFLICLPVLLSPVVYPLKATHIMGVDVNYECINNCTIRVNLRVYRDCGGASGVGLMDFAFNGGPGCIPPQQIGQWTPPGATSDVTSWNVTEVTPVCPGTVTQCQNPGSGIRGVEEYQRSALFEICNTNCNSYTIECPCSTSLAILLAICSLFKLMIRALEYQIYKCIGHHGGYAQKL